MSSKSLSLSLSFAFVASCIAGCGTGSSAPPEPVFPVSGVITVKGKPLAGATVTFKNDEKDRSAFGQTDEEGRYQLTTFSQNDGAVPGNSVVTVVKASAVDDVPVASIDSEEYEPPGFGANEEPEAPKNEISQQYANAKTSGLFANVLESGENKFDFELK